jgi:hypothetical protein
MMVAGKSTPKVLLSALRSSTAPSESKPACISGCSEPTSEPTMRCTATNTAAAVACRRSPAGAAGGAWRRR